MSDKAFFEKVGECTTGAQLLATGMQAQTNLGYAKFKKGTYKTGQLVTIKAGIAEAYKDSDKIIEVASSAATKNRFAIVKDNFTAAGDTGSEELHVVYLTGSFYKDTVEAVTGQTVTLEHELEMNAEGIWLSNQHL